MQKGVDQVSDSCDSYDLTISIKKTEVVYQPAPGKPYKEPTITVIGQRLQVVYKFTYLGSTLSRFVHIDDEVNARIAKASAAFGRLRGSIWDRSGIRLDTKLKVYRAVVLPTLLYACETWTVYQRHAKRLNHFHTSCLRKLLKIKWQDRIPDTEVLKRPGMQSIHTHRPRWLSWMRRPTGDQEVAGSTPAEVGNILSWRLIMKYFLRSFSPFR